MVFNADGIDGRHNGLARFYGCCPLSLPSISSEANMIPCGILRSLGSDRDVDPYSGSVGILPDISRR